MTLAASLSTLFGIGRAHYAPGTVASVEALPIAAAIAATGGRFVLLAVALFVTAIGGWASEHYVRERAIKDPSECVIDELAGQLLACAFAPLGILAYALAFALFRVLDIFKPWPISAVEEFPGGMGVMADDLVAGVLTGLVVAVFAHAGIV